MKNDKKYKVGMIGCGMIFDRHIEAITSNSEHFKLAALCDIDNKKLSIRATEYSVPGYEDYKDMLKEMKGKMNLVVIATPNSLHYEQAMDSLNAGYNILVEKPIDFKHERVESIVAKAKEMGLEAYAVLQVRYNPTINMLKEALENNYVGDIRSVSLVQRWQRPSSYFDSWRADINVGGRTLYEVGIHYLDIVQMLFGLPSVKASSSFNNKHKHVEFEDTVFAIVQYPNKASGSIEVTIASEPSNLECSISILGSEGFIKVGGRALDKVEKALFSNVLLEKKWETLVQKNGHSLEPNSYGTHAGSCPNHPTLYQEIAEGRGLSLEEAVNSIKYIEEVYSKEIV
jgi:UDP-N-acetyl-2-amino-2-deoxyglucuronate dehydrogenase